MKIVDLNQLGIAGAAAHETSSTEAAGGRRGGPGAAGPAHGQDHAEVSGLAGKLTEATSTEAANRAARVERLRTAVDQGAYQVDARAVSQGIVRDALTKDAGAGQASGQAGAPEGNAGSKP
jgi:flagellar biosynthesis anti-sigma factor FlgM